MPSRQAAFDTVALPASASGSRLLPPLLAVMLGVMVLGLVGFAPLEVVHNAAHDTRHSTGFPCH